MSQREGLTPASAACFSLFTGIGDLALLSRWKDRFEFGRRELRRRCGTRSRIVSAVLIQREYGYVVNCE